MTPEQLQKLDPLHDFHRREKTPPVGADLQTIADAIKQRQGASIAETARSLGFSGFGSAAQDASLSPEARQYEHAVGIRGLGVLAQRILDLEKKVEELQRKGAPAGAEYR